MGFWKELLHSSRYRSLALSSISLIPLQTRNRILILPPAIIIVVAFIIVSDVILLVVFHSGRA